LKQFWNDISLHSKILILVFSIIILVSGLSLIIVQSISNVSDISNEMELQTPEMVWIHSLQKQVSIKQLMVKQMLEDASFTMPEEVLSANDKLVELERIYGKSPQSIETFVNELNLINFIYTNKVEGLLRFNNTAMVREVLENEMLPMLNKLEAKLAAAYHKSYFSLEIQTNQIEEIINRALWTLMVVFSLATAISVYIAYRISQSIVRPIDRLIEDVGKISDGNYGLQVAELEQFELRKLASSINQMSLSLSESFGTIIKEKMLREQILASIPIAIITTQDETGKIEINQRAQEFINIAPERLHDILNGRESDPVNAEFWSWFHLRAYFTTRKTLFHNGNNKYQVLASQSPLKDEREEEVGRIFYFIDISEMEYMEKRIHRSEKLAVLGELAAGAAHEIRNPLAVIDGFIQIIRSRMDESDREKYHLDMLMEELKRINKIIERMLLLAKPEAPQIKRNSIHDVLNSIMPLIKANCPPGISIHVQMDDFMLNIDFEQFKQVFHNLIRNSIEAIERQGEIRIYSQLQSAEVSIYIEDSGGGIPVELQRQIFDPFISAKEDGTGLGLSIIQRIIENHKGEVQLVSSNEQGTMIKMILPLAEVNSAEC
jgi:two-component system sensor histidine kinase AtoS